MLKPEISGMDGTDCGGATLDVSRDIAEKYLRTRTTGPNGLSRQTPNIQNSYAFKLSARRRPGPATPVSSARP